MPLTKDELDTYFANRFSRLLKDLDPPPPSLCNMCHDVMTHIVEKFNPVERMVVRKVCRNLKLAVDSCKLHKLSFEMKVDGIKLFLNEEKIDYTDVYNNCTITYGTKTKSIHGISSMEVAFKDLATQFEAPINQLTIRYERTVKEIKRTSFQIALQNVLGPVRARNIKLLDISFDDILAILPNFDADYLHKIAIQPLISDGRFEEIVKLEQWTKARELQVHGNFDVAIIENMFHFEKFDIYMSDFSSEDAVKIRDILLKQKKFKACRILFCSRNPIDISVVFQPNYSDGSNFFYKSSDSSQFKIDYNWAGDEWVIQIDRI